MLKKNKNKTNKKQNKNKTKKKKKKKTHLGQIFQSLTSFETYNLFIIIIIIIFLFLALCKKYTAETKTLKHTIKLRHGPQQVYMNILSHASTD